MTKQCLWCSGLIPIKSSKKFCTHPCYVAAGGRKYQVELEGRKAGTIINKTKSEINREYYYRNHELVKTRGRKYYSRNKEAYNNRRLKARYGITQVEYDAMYLAQQGRCVICGEVPKVGKKTPLVVDHNHTTGKPRKLLCSSCNTMTGFIETHPERVEKINEYLRNHQ